MHHPRIELGSRPWQGRILPLDQWCGKAGVTTVRILQYIYFVALGIGRLARHCYGFMLVPLADANCVHICLCLLFLGLCFTHS